MNRELLQQALDALVHAERNPGLQARLREALAAPMPEPVAWLCENAAGHRYFRWKKPMSEYKPVPLYAAPPAAPAPAVPVALVEEVAKAIYWEWRRDAGYVPWVDGGNSFKQDDARKIARAVVSDAAPVVRDAELAQLRQYLDTAQRRASALGDEVAGLREDAARWAKEANDRDDIACAWGAACAFIDSHVANPDIAQEMQKTYAEFQKWREHLAARKGEAKRPPPSPSPRF